MKKVITFGEIMLRLSSPGYARLCQKDSFNFSFCGSEANVAVSLSLFGLNSSFVTVLPDNDIGNAAVSCLNSYHVDLSHISKKHGRMGLLFLEKGVSQRPSKVIYDRAFSAFSLSRKDEYDWNVIFSNAEWFHFSGITPALSEELAEACVVACQKAKQMGIMISCDLNYREKLWTVEKARSVMTRLIEFVDVCFANEEDVEKTLGIKADDSDVERGIINNNSYSAAAKAVAEQYGCKFVAMTLRESYSASFNRWGALLYSSQKDKTFFSKKYDIHIVDRVGSGDSFAAGMIYGLMSRMDYQKATDFAAAASCLNHSIEGDFNRITVEDVNILLSTGGNGRVQR